ncbi:transcription termination factor Rho [Williamsia sp. CHRR-6]|uniref:transcription termination factor Rho n=1 Tax=Williamsia sp. CHRR-6 TaxID=2835871 RepID=UPI001BDAD714|nr:transcription termination factor Rho [Williamsia sp. CHRR-6]MBT0568431.1 transcription termination factor Rho [Williamsia sp. CHRR-6]
MTDTDLISTPSTEASSESAGDSHTSTPAKAKTSSGRSGGLNGMVLTELRQLAGELGIKGTSGMRKGDLVAAIADRQGGSSAAASAARSNGRRPAPETSAPEPTAPEPTARETARSGASAPDDTAAATAGSSSGPSTAEPASSDTTDRTTGRRNRTSNDADSGGSADTDTRTENTGAERTRRRERSGGDRNNTDRNNTERNNTDRNGGERNGGERNQNRDNQNQNRDGSRSNGPRDDSDDEGTGRGRRGRRFRERRRGRDRDGVGGGERDTTVSEDDVLQPVAGILDVLDNYAFVRTSGYLAGPNDVYVSMNLVRKNGLRRGDALTGAVKLPRDGEQNNQRQKFNPLVRLDSVNGGDVEAARRRPEFGKLTPLYPNERLRLETTPERLDTRVIDLIMPIGKGQRALIVSPPKAGKTTILQDIANAISINNPECYLMVVLVDERPEEVTDMTRSVKGEVIASTFDRPPTDHTSVAELAIERAKRLVENGKDVVVLLDSITRLGRAYNNASPASGRILSGGVDSTALYPPKRFLGAARNIENGGSLTIIASALVETGSTGDTVIFEEFKGTGNAELKLDRKISERRVFPAVDVNLSSTRKDELMMSADEFAIVHKLRRVLSGLDSQQAIDLLLSQLKKTKTNIEFLMQVQKTAPGSGGED